MSLLLLQRPFSVTTGRRSSLLAPPPPPRHHFRTSGVKASFTNRLISRCSKGALTSTTMADIAFPVFGVQHELLGYAYAASANCGDIIWAQALTLGANMYSVSEAAIKPIGVKLRNHHLLGVDASSNMPIPQLASEGAEWLVAPPPDTPSVMERNLMSRMDAMDERARDQAKSIAQQAESIDQQDKRIDQQDKNIAQQDKRIDQQDKNIAQHAEQISKLNNSIFWPLCIRQLCVLAADIINMQSGNKHGSGTINPKSAAPPHANDWLKSMGVSVQLDEADLAVIFVTTPGNVHGDANKAAHKIKKEDQAVAVRAVADVQQRARLARVFAFVHGHPVTDS